MRSPISCGALHEALENVPWVSHLVLAGKAWQLHDFLATEAFDSNTDDVDVWKHTVFCFTDCVFFKGDAC